jgi:hypothetical protein
MKLYQLTLVVASLFLIGCGSSDNKGSNSDVKEAKTVTEAENNFKSFGALSNLDRGTSSFNKNSKMQKISKNESPCSNGGTLSISSDNTILTMVFNKCKEDSVYINGEMVITENESNYNSKIVVKDLTLKEEEINFYSKKFVIEENEVEYWSTIDGDVKIDSKCFSGNFYFKTIEKMYEIQDNTDSIEKGKIVLNGATYTFNNPNVTITVGSETKTITQVELEKEFESSTSCSE